MSVSRGQQVHQVIDAHCHLGEVLDKTRSTDLQSVLEGESNSPED